MPWLAYAFPFTSTVAKSAELLRGSIMSHLPRMSTAQRLCEIYYRHAAWMFVARFSSPVIADKNLVRIIRYTPINELDFYESIFRPVYDPDNHEVVGSHSLALLYMVLALGTLLDLDLPAHNPESMQFYQLGRAALAIDSVLEVQSIPGIQALVSGRYIWSPFET